MAAAVAAVVAAALVEGMTKGEAMSEQRKCLDRGRKIALEGRPYEVKWRPLLELGMTAVRDGCADTAPPLAEVMWEDATLAYLTDQADQGGRASIDPLPRDVARVRELLDMPDGITAGSPAHLMTGYGASVSEGTVHWYAGVCAYCLRAMLLRVDDAARLFKWWTFYDQETT
ncbi:hypothetical protein [Brachybacterium vulturis]|uniref:hypothetical protein n=1 Tax=Brachybacterium vulturis TaxID=2017484 RepID=UPI003736EA9E